MITYLMLDVTASGLFSMHSEGEVLSESEVLSDTSDTTDTAGSEFCSEKVGFSRQFEYVKE